MLRDLGFGAWRFRCLEVAGLGFRGRRAQGPLKGPYMDVKA